MFAPCGRNARNPALVGLLGVLALLVLVIGRVQPLPWPWPARWSGGGEPPARPFPAVRTVADGVTVWGTDLSGRTTAGVRTWLFELAPSVRHEPVPAHLDPVTGGLIPELYGTELDVDATEAAVLAAAPGTRVRPHVAWIRPDLTRADFPLAPIYRANPAKSNVAFVINVAWGNEELVEMLNVLAAEQVRATFFLVGRWVDAYPDLAREIATRGHEIANHGYSDAVSIGRLDYGNARRDLQRAHDAIARVTDRQARYFSPHRGELSRVLFEVCRDLGYRLTMWSVDTIDWQDPSRETLLRRVLPRAGPGALILMHPREVTVASLPSLIAGLREQGLTPVTLGELLDPRPVIP